MNNTSSHGTNNDGARARATRSVGNSIYALRLRYTTTRGDETRLEYGHYSFLYSTRIIHFFVPLFGRFFMRNCYIFMDFNCANESHPIRSKFNGSFWRDLAANWHYDGAMPYYTVYAI